VPSGWTVTAHSATTFHAVDTGQIVHASFQVLAPTPAALFQTGTLTGKADYTWPGHTPISVSVDQSVTTTPPVQLTYRTYSSATDAPAAFGQAGNQFGISGTGADLFSNTDAYSSTYLAGAVTTSSTVDTQVSSQQNFTGYGKAGIIIRNTMTAANTTPEGVILFESPSGGVQLEWNSNAGIYIDSVTPANGTIADTLPVHLELERTSSATYTGYYSLDGNGWSKVGTATVPGQADRQDAGIFITSHATGSPAQATFNGFSAADGAVTAARTDVL